MAGFAKVLPYAMQNLNFNRRAFLRFSGAGLTAAALSRALPLWAADAEVESWDPARPLRKAGRVLKIQPLFLYSLPQRKEATSWKSWGGVQTAQAVEEEIARIQRELAGLKTRAEFGVEFSPVQKVATMEEAKRALENPADAVLLYACSGRGDVLKAILANPRDTVIYVRKASGPAYYWFEGLSVQYLATSKTASPDAAARPHVEDVVVDDYDEVLWRLRGLYGKLNLPGTRVVALGGTWGKYAAEAPVLARDLFKLDIVEVSYEDLGRRIQKARGNGDLVAAAGRAARKYLELPNTRLDTRMDFVSNAFVLHRVFKDLLGENQAGAFTIKSCMGTVMPMSGTTACLTLSLLNDEGWMAFCESDFVVIPAGVLLRYISGKPVFLHNSTFPHQRTVTCAHCTAPRRMNGRSYEPATVLTHFESDYGAAPKVDLPLGQELTFIDPDYTTGRWLGFKGRVAGNPSYEICRSQQDVEIQGDWKKLLGEVRDSHWLMSYGDYVREAGYAARKLGMKWETLET